MESAGVTNIESDYHRYSQTGTECRVRNINGRAMLLDSTAIIVALLFYITKLHFYWPLSGVQCLYMYISIYMYIEGIDNYKIRLSIMESGCQNPAFYAILVLIRESCRPALF